MRYVINVSEVVPEGGVVQTRPFCEIRLETTDRQQADDMFLTMRAAWPIRQVRRDASFQFKLVGTEEYDLEG